MFKQLTVAVEFFEGFTARAPVFEPYRTPAYSNAAFRILAYALEAAAGKSYARVLEELVTGPLNLTRTSTTTPSKDSGVITIGDGSWYQNLGDESPYVALVI